MDIGSISLVCTAEITFANPEWAGIMDQGKENARVDSPTIHLPQGGEAKSGAAVIHGQEFFGTSEPGSNFIENGYKKIRTLLPGLISDLFSGNGDIASIEMFLTSVVQADVEGISDEYRDNPNEAIATDQVIHSIYVKVTVSPPPEEARQQIIEKAKQHIMSELKGALS